MVDQIASPNWCNRPNDQTSKTGRIHQFGGRWKSLKFSVSLPKWNHSPWFFLGGWMCITRWWFQVYFLDLKPKWGNDPSWLTFFRWVQTTHVHRPPLTPKKRLPKSGSKLKWFHASCHGDNGDGCLAGDWPKRHGNGCHWKKLQKHPKAVFVVFGCGVVVSWYGKQMATCFFGC